MREYYNKMHLVPENSMLTFLNFTDKRADKHIIALYRCSCGVEKEIKATNVKTGKVKSCGCLRHKTQVCSEEKKLAISIKNTLHGLRKHPLYKIWSGIKGRCADKKNKDYGGRGVTVCSEWLNDFKAFYDWAIINGWKKGLQIDKDKIPRELGIPAILYSPDMCCFLTPKENMNAMSTNRIIEYGSKKQNLCQWAEELKLNYPLLLARFKNGWSVKRALFTPQVTTKETGLRRRKVILNTETGIFYNGVKEAAASIGQHKDTLFHKLSGSKKNNTPLKYV